MVNILNLIFNVLFPFKQWYTTLLDLKEGIDSAGLQILFLAEVHW